MFKFLQIVSWLLAKITGADYRNVMSTILRFHPEVAQDTDRFERFFDYDDYENCEKVYDKLGRDYKWEADLIRVKLRAQLDMVNFFSDHDDVEAWIVDTDNDNMHMVSVVISENQIHLEIDDFDTFTYHVSDYALHVTKDGYNYDVISEAQDASD